MKQISEANICTGIFVSFYNKVYRCYKVIDFRIVKLIIPSFERRQNNLYDLYR